VRRAHARARRVNPQLITGHPCYPPARCKAQIYPLIFIVMPRQLGAKNKTRIEMTLSSWYSEKLRELRDDSGFESDQAFSRWLLTNTIQVLAGEREPGNKKLSDLRVRMEEALSTCEEPGLTHE